MQDERLKREVVKDQSVEGDRVKQEARVENACGHSARRVGYMLGSIS